MHPPRQICTIAVHNGVPYLTASVCGARSLAMIEGRLYRSNLRPTFVHARLQGGRLWLGVLYGGARTTSPVTGELEVKEDDEYTLYEQFGDYGHVALYWKTRSRKRYDIYDAQVTTLVA